MQESKISASDIVKRIQGEGFQAKIEDIGDGHHFIETSANGLAFRIRIYPAVKNPNYVASVMFSAAFTADEVDINKFEAINQWNGEKRFVLAYVDEDGDYVLQGDTPILFGCSADHVIDFFYIFAGIVPSFREYLKEAGLWA